MSKPKNNISFEELSELIVSAINDEPFFTKEVLIPKVRAILRGFNANINATHYNRIESPSDAARRLRSIEVNRIEKNFWKTKCQDLVGGSDFMQSLYEELNLHLTYKGYNN